MSYTVFRQVKVISVEELSRSRIDIVDSPKQVPVFGDFGSSDPIMNTKIVRQDDYLVFDLTLPNEVAKRYNLETYYPAVIVSPSSIMATFEISGIKLIDKETWDNKNRLSNVDHWPLSAYIEKPVNKCTCGAAHTSFPQFHSNWCDLK